MQLIVSYKSRLFKMIDQTCKYVFFHRLPLITWSPGLALLQKMTGWAWACSLTEAMTLLLVLCSAFLSPSRMENGPSSKVFNWMTLPRENCLWLARNFVKRGRRLWLFVKLNPTTFMCQDFIKIINKTSSYLVYTLVTCSCLIFWIVTL